MTRNLVIIAAFLQAYSSHALEEYRVRLPFGMILKLCKNKAPNGIFDETECEEQSNSAESVNMNSLNFTSSYSGSDTTLNYLSTYYVDDSYAEDDAGEE